ncbi:hypothetical protein QFZ21_002439 [Microbacterium sp. W4I20]|nr:hypothetical protein [Microbacterium sp. W4I20]
MAEHEGEAGESRGLRAVADHQCEEAELADRSEGEDALEVGLAQRLDAAEKHGHDAEGDDDRPPGSAEREDRGEPRDEIDAGLHHGRGVQVCAHRGGGGHRAGQPEVEGEESRLADGADQQHDDRGVDDRSGRGDLEYLADAGRAGIHHQQHDPHEHHQTAEGGDQQGLQRGSSADRTTSVMTDEEVREDARHLPEHHEHHQVVGEDQPVHRAGETEQHARELADAGRVVEEIPAAVQQHQRADARHDQGEDPSQDVHVHRQVQTELRNPGDGDVGRRAVEDVGGAHQRMDECRGGNESRDDECLRPQPAHQHGHQQRPEEEDGEERQHIRGSLGARRPNGTGGRVSVQFTGTRGPRGSRVR